MGKSKQRATYDDLRKLPDHVVGEIIAGELVVSPRPSLPHANAAGGLTGELRGPFHGPPGGGGRPGGWIILPEPELHLGEDVLVPDLAGWRRERMPKMPNTPAVELPPDWVCENLSKSTERYDRGPKRDIYARVGVTHLWFLNPLIRTLEVMRLDGVVYTITATHSGDVHVRVPPFEAIELDLSRLWPETEEET